MNEPESVSATARQPWFYPVGLRKFAIMHVATIGFYELHWFYENWWLIKARRGAKFNPGTRTFLAPLFAWALFWEIRKAADEERIPTAFSPAGAATAYLLGALSAFVLIDDLWPVALLLLYIPLHLAQHLAIQVNAIRAAEVDRNEHLTTTNRLALVVGGVVFCAALLASVEGIMERYHDGVEQGQEVETLRTEVETLERERDTERPARLTVLEGRRCGRPCSSSATPQLAWSVAVLPQLESSTPQAW